MVLLLEGVWTLSIVWSLFLDTDLTLTTERLVELFASVDDEFVEYIGERHLDTPPSKRREFQMNYQNPAQRKEAYLDYYVHNNPFASWSKIADALRYYGLPRQAAVVENTYIQGIKVLRVDTDFCEG